MHSTRMFTLQSIVISSSTKKHPDAYRQLSSGLQSRTWIFMCRLFNHGITRCKNRCTDRTDWCFSLSVGCLIRNEQCQSLFKACQNKDNFEKSDCIDCWSVNYRGWCWETIWSSWNMCKEHKLSHYVPTFACLFLRFAPLYRTQLISMQTVPIRIKSSVSDQHCDPGEVRPLVTHKRNPKGLSPDNVRSRLGS